MLRLAIITDIHHGPDQGTKKGSQAKRLFSRFTSWLNDFSPDMLIDLGDRVSDVDYETDLLLAKEVASWFKAIDLPQAHLLGNHDLAELSIAENESAFGCSFKSHSQDIKGFHLVFWNADVKLSQEHGFELSDQDLDWLRTDLSQTVLPTIVFSHVPLDNGSMKGNFYFDTAYPHHASYPERLAEKVREILERSRKVILCLNGHAHWNAYHCIDGIHYITLPSLTETFPSHPKVCESWTEVTLGLSIAVKVHGNLPIEYRLPVRDTQSEHWLNVDKEYAPQITEPR